MQYGKAYGLCEANAEALVRGVCRLLRDMGFAWLAEFRLSSGRRAGVCGIDRKGTILIVEIKPSIAEFRDDQK
jgi:hypothetical protein